MTLRLYANIASGNLTYHGFAVPLPDGVSPTLPHGAVSGAFTYTGIAPMSRQFSKSTALAITDSTLSTFSGTTSGQFGFIYAVSPPLAAQTISGTIDGAVEATASGGSPVMRAQLYRVTPRGVFSALTSLYTSGSAMNASSVNRRIFAGASLTSTAVADGDRLVLWLGMNRPASGSSFTFTLKGSAGQGSDLPSTPEASSGTGNGFWVEFSTDPVFSNYVPKQTPIFVGGWGAAVASAAPPADTTPPAIGTPSPPPGSISRTQALSSIAITDATEVNAVHAWVVYSTDSRREHVCADAVFSTEYDAGSSLTGLGTTSATLTVQRDSPGWRDSFTLYVRAYDAAGNYTESSFAYTVSGAPFAPSIGAPSVAGSARAQTLTYAITDDLALVATRIKAWIAYTTLAKRDLIYDGTTFQAGFSSGSSLSGTDASTSRSLVLAANSPGWLDAGTVAVEVSDADGNKTTRSDALSVSGYPFAPSIGVPDVGGSGRTQTLTYAITDDAGISRVEAWVAYTTSTRRDLIYNGSAFQTGYSAGSSLSGSSTSKTLVLAHDSPGWLDAGTVTVVVYDADGNVTTRSDAISVSGYPFVPSIGAPTPAAASELGRLDSVSIPITDDAGIADVSCWVVYSSGERPEPVYEGGAACSSFDDTTALSGSSTSKTLIVARNAPGWLGDPTIHVSVKDLDGNVTTTSYAYTAEGYPYEPTLSASTPIAGSSLDSDDTVTFTITAPNTLDDVLVWLDYGAGGAEIAFWGTVAGGSALGSYVVDVTGDASEATLEISRTGGWRGPFDLRVEAVDLEGGQVSGTFAAFEAPVLYVDPTPPTVAAITSTASPRHRSDPLVLELEDTFSLAGALVLVKLPSGSWEGAYDGAEWAPRYASSALEVVSASLWRITLRRDGGWPVVGTPPTVDVCVRVFDTSGNLYTA